MYYFHLWIRKKNAKTPLEKKKRRICLTLGLIQVREELLCWQGRRCGSDGMVFKCFLSLLWAFFSLGFALFSFIFPFFLLLFSSLLLLGSQHFHFGFFFGFWFFFSHFLPFLPFSSISSHGSLLLAQTLLFFSLFLTWYFFLKLAYIVSCFTPLFIDNDEALGTFLGGMFVAIKFS